MRCVDTRVDECNDNVFASHRIMGLIDALLSFDGSESGSVADRTR